jgi:hypothetical protein
VSQRNTLVRSMHDLGLAAWFGGSLMGVVGLNGAASEAKSPTERLRISSIGWARWSPLQFAAMVTHGIGGVGLILGNKDRLALLGEARTNTNIKLAVTGAAILTTFYSGIVGKKQADHIGEPVEGATEASATSSSGLRAAQGQQKVLQWLIPAFTAVLIVLAAQQGEQQRPAAGWLKSAIRR